jgi:hypothetical protein
MPVSDLFLIDESGHCGQMPYEVHGGILVPLDSAWPLIQEICDAQRSLFGKTWKEFGVELKGDRLLKKKVFRHADSHTNFDLDDDYRRECAQSFLDKGVLERQSRENGAPRTLRRTSEEYRAYGESCLMLVDAILSACERFNATVLAAAVEQKAPRPPVNEWEEMLRKDFVYLFERLYYRMQQLPVGRMAMIVCDAKDDLGGARCVQGERLNLLIERYFTQTLTGRKRSARIFPEPVYCRSDLTTLLGVADLMIYVINHAFRPTIDWTLPVRPELARFATRILKLERIMPREDGSTIWTIFRMDDLRPASQRIGKTA